uniref:FAST kinase domains 3 n=1 Tax=Salmo trutta TaxID=8032 RepID=A0A673ZMA3_SALTR
MAAAALHRVADPEGPLSVLCCQLEQDSSRLTETGLVSALLACTHLYVDPWSTLPDERGQLCTFGQALEGPGCGMLEQVMEQVQKQEPGLWSLAELTAVYGLLQAGVGEEGSYQDLLNAMHTPSWWTQEGVCMVQVLKMAFTSHPETVTKVMQYFGCLNILSLPVFDAVAESLVSRADIYSTSQVARQIIPFGKLGYLSPNPRTLLNLLHSCVLVERFPVNFVSKVFNLYFLQRLQGTLIDKPTGQIPGMGVVLAQLYMTVKLECPFYEGPRLHPMYHVKFFLTPVLTPYCYTLDVEIKLDEDGYVLPASEIDDIFKRIAVCIDGHEVYWEKRP